MVPLIPFPRWVNTEPQAVSRYGEILGNSWPDMDKWCSLIQIPPFAQCIKNSLTGFPLTHLYCNKDMTGPLLAALQNVKSANIISELHTFDGCYSVRKIRGDKLIQSAHSWAGAIDFNASENALGEKPAFSDALVKCFTDVGFAWGGDFKRQDGMHFSWLQF